MKKLIILGLVIGLLMGCASTFRLTVDSTGKIISMEAVDTAVRYDPKTGMVTAIPNRWFSTKIFTDILNVLNFTK
jgi:hypothetical protein